MTGASFASVRPVGGGVGFGFSTSVPTLPAAISRSAITVGLSRSARPGAWRRRDLARAVGRGERELEAVGNAFMQSSTVMRAMRSLPRKSSVRGCLRRMMLARARALAASKSLLIIGIRIRGHARFLRGRWPAGAGSPPRVSCPRLRRRPLELLQRGRQDEDADQSGKSLRTCCAPCQSISSSTSWSRSSASLDHRFAGAVVVAVDLGVLEELAARRASPRTRARRRSGTRGRPARPGAARAWCRRSTA